MKRYNIDTYQGKTRIQESLTGDWVKFDDLIDIAEDVDDIMNILEKLKERMMKLKLWSSK